MENKLKEAINHLNETKEILENFSSKEEAVEYLVKETGLPKEECSNAYDFLMKFDLENSIYK